MYVSLEQSNKVLMPGAPAKKGTLKNHCSAMKRGPCYLGPSGLATGRFHDHAFTLPNISSPNLTHN